MLNIALPKGRLGEKVYRMLECAGYGCEELLKEKGFQVDEEGFSACFG